MSAGISPHFSQAALDNFVVATEAYSQDMLDLRFELKEHVTREEWGEIFSAYR